MRSAGTGRAGTAATRAVGQGGLVPQFKSQEAPLFWRRGGAGQAGSGRCCAEGTALSLLPRAEAVRVPGEGTQPGSRDPGSDLRIGLECGRVNLSAESRGPEEAKRGDRNLSPTPVPGPFGDAAVARRRADELRLPRLRFRKGLWERPGSSRAKMAEAAESPGEPGTTSPRPLVSWGSATEGTEGEAECPLMKSGDELMA